MNIGERMKHNYENITRNYLTKRTPVIARIDGHCFHTFCKQFDRPFDSMFRFFMERAAEKLKNEVQGLACIYVQSDEISVLITDYTFIETQSWFDYNIQKMSSILSSIITAEFNRCYIETWMRFNTGLHFDLEHRTEFLKMNLATFDCRVFNIPKDEVHNYFVWRQQDCIRNSKQMFAMSLFSQKEMQNKNTDELVKMCRSKGKDWEELDLKWKYGSIYDGSEWATPFLFTEKPAYISSFVYN